MIRKKTQDGGEAKEEEDKGERWRSMREKCGNRMERKGKEGVEGGREHHAHPPSSALTHMGDLGLKPSL